MPKILFVLETTIIGGIERLALNLLKALPATYEKHVIITEKEGLFTDSFKASSNTYQFLKGYTPDASSTVSQLRDIIKTGKFDIVHVFNGIQNLMAIPRGVRCVFTAGGDYNREVYWERAKFFGYTKDKILSEMSGLNITIFTDKDTNKYVFPNNVKISRNIISFKSYSDTPKDPKKVIWVGRNSFEKRPDILQNIAKCMPEYTFIQCLAEEGSTHPENKINNVIVYYNVLDDEWMQTLYAESSICLNTSDTEGIPLSILEAHSQGCHVIGRNATKGINDTTVSNPRTDEFVKVIRSCPIESDDTRRERGKKVIDESLEELRNYISVYDLKSAIRTPKHKHVCVISTGLGHEKHLAELLDCDLLEYREIDKLDAYPVIIRMSIDEPRVLDELEAQRKKYPMKVIILWWIGTDVDHFVNIWTHEEQQRVRNLGARNITVSIGNQQELVDCKVMSEVITLVPQPEKDLQPCPLPKEFTVSIYLPAKWKDTWFSYYYGVLRLHKYQDLLRIMGYTPNIQYKVYGNTSDIDFKGLNNVQVLGWIESPESVIRASSCHLRLTTHDGFPQSIIEAILLGRHVITNHEYPVIPAIIRPNDIVARLNELMNKKEIVDPTVTNAYKLFCEREREKARALIKTLAFTPLTGGGCLTFVQEIAKKLPCNVVDACIPDKEMYNRLIASGVTIIPQAEGYISPVINSITSMPLYIAHAFYSAEDIRIHPPLKYSNDSILANAKKAIKVLTLSDSTKDWLIKNGIPKEKITVFRNPIDIDDLQRKKESRKSLFLNRPDVKKAGITEGNFYLYIGFDSHVKNPYQFRRLAVGFPQDKFIMMGYNLEKYAGTNCLVIPFTDHDTALGAIAAAKMLIITSSHESGPRVLLEAIVQGTPAITTLDGLGQDEINRVVFGTRQAAFGYYPDDEKRLFEIFSNLKKMSKDSILKLREGKCNIEQYDIKNCIHYFEEAIQ